MSERLPSKYIIHEMPYYAQWESPELVDSILQRMISAKADPKWINSGAATAEEYEYWSWNTCGMSCLKSILKYTHGLDFPTIQLARRCAAFGGYKQNQNDIEGLYYQPFVDFIKADFNLDARVSSNLTISDIISEIANQNFVIVSVHPSIRDPHTIPMRKGGHLVLVTGYNLEDQSGALYVHDPSGYYLKSQQYALISLGDFNKFFANRGIIIDNPKRQE
jgi:hypothetical protein